MLVGMKTGSISARSNGKPHQRNVSHITARLSDPNSAPSMAAAASRSPAPAGFDWGTTAAAPTPRPFHEVSECVLLFNVRKQIPIERSLRA